MNRLSESRRRRHHHQPRDVVDRRDEGDRREPPSRSSIFGVITVFALLVLAVVAFGRNSLTKKGGQFQLSGSPEEILIDLARRYQKIESYEDRMLMRMETPKDSSWPDDRADLLIRFVRPNKIRLQVSRSTSQLLLTCDGEQLHTQLLDENTAQL